MPGESPPEVNTAIFFMLFGLLGQPYVAAHSMWLSTRGQPYLVAHTGATLHKTPPYQLDERLRDFAAIVVTPVELCSNPHEITFGAVEARKII